MVKHKPNAANDGILGLPTYESKKYLPRNRKQRSFLANLVLRSTVLYTLYYILWACPSVPNKDSPQVCQRYYDLKNLVVTNAVPHLQPYYEQYASPYISKGQPYYDQANRAYSRYGKPVLEKASQVAQPVLDKGASAAQAQYSAHLAPHVNKYYNSAAKTYQTYLGKHVDTVTGKYYSDVAPHVDTVRSKSNDLLQQARPHAENAFVKGRELYSTHAHPRILNGYYWILSVLETHVYPSVRRFYLLRVEPQINKVSDKLFHFNISRGFASLDKNDADTVQSSVSSSILASITTTASLESTVIAGETISVEAPQASVDAKSQKRINRGVIDDLLSIAENNIIREGEAAKEVLQSRLEETLPSMIKKETILCEDYLTQLEALTIKEIKGVETRIHKLARLLANKNRPTDEISEELRPYFAKAGKKIHSEAVEVRAHLSTAMDTLKSRVSKASYAVYEQVVSEAANQKKAPEQALRYDMDDVAKSDLRRLEALDDKVRKIGKDLDSVADSTLYSYAKDLKKLLESTESKVESLAGGAANKLQTLHSIGPKKITLNDDSDEFGHGYLPFGAMLGAQAIYNQISVGVLGASEPTSRPDGSFESFEEFAEALSMQMSKDSLNAAYAAATAAVSEQAVKAASYVSEAAVNVDTDAIIGSAKVIATGAADAAQSAYTAVADAVTNLDTDELKASVIGMSEYVGEKAADIASGASEVVYGTPPAFTESIASRASEIIYGSEVPLHESVASQVSGAYEAIVDKASELYNGAETPSAITDKIADKASELLYGTQTPVIESIKDRVSEAYENIAEKASDLLHGSDASPLSKSASSMSSKAAASASSVSSVASAAAAAASSSASSMAAASSSSLSSAASVASVSAAKSASSASSLASVASLSASKSASSVSVSIAASASSAASAASSLGKDKKNVVVSIAGEAGDQYEAYKDKLEGFVEGVRQQLDL